MPYDRILLLIQLLIKIIQLCITPIPEHTCLPISLQQGQATIA